MKCSFCEQPLVCKACGSAYTPRSPEAHQAVYQPDMEILCPNCQQMLVCQSCGFEFGAPEREEG